jgi:hypothetical protein
MGSKKGKMSETTAVEMNVICAFCGELKCNCTCGRTDKGTFRIVCLGEKRK